MSGDLLWRLLEHEALACRAHTSEMNHLTISTDSVPASATSLCAARGSDSGQLRSKKLGSRSSLPELGHVCWAAAAWMEVASVEDSCGTLWETEAASAILFLNLAATETAFFPSLIFKYSMVLPRML